MALDDIRTGPTAEDGRRLTEVWEDAPGVPGFLNTVDHKRIGVRYIVTAFAFFLVGGVQALLLRTQLATPEGGVLSPELYNQLFTMHGTTMIFLFNTPIIAGFGNYLVPLQIGARDMAFPRLNAMSYWIFLLAGLFLYTSFGVGAVPDTGWFAYVPLSTEFSPGVALDFWALGVVFLGISTTAGGLNFIVTIFKLRAPGMSVSRLPLFVWAILVTSFIIVFALPAITLGPLLMAFDNILGTHFYNVALGGDPVLYQHLFWFWGHPEVYILFIPATGMVSMIVPAFARRPLAGYTWAVASLVAIGFVSFGVWVHHMFAVGLPDVTMSFFSIAGLGIAFPSAVQVFLWIATLWSGRPVWRTPLLFTLGFIVIFVLGGITGVMVSLVPFDWQATDSYFVVAHLHYVLIGGVVFPIFAAFYHWAPKVTGWLLDDRLGRVSFWLMFVGFNVAFFPQHIVGLYGMPRRVYTYPAGLGWDVYNLVSTIGAFVIALGILVTVVNAGWSWRRRRPAGPDPWDAGTLEWATTSPPAPFNFAEIPDVGRRYPLWRKERMDRVQVEREAVDLPPHGTEHQTVETSRPEARLEAILDMPHPSYWPFVVSVALLGLFSALLLRSVELGGVALAVMTLAIVRWHWQETTVPGEETRT